MDLSRYGLPREATERLEQAGVSAETLARLATHPGVSLTTLYDIARAHRVPTRAVDRELASMGDRLAKAWRHAQEVARAQVVSGFWACYQTALHAKQTTAAVGALREIARLFGLNKPIQVELVAPDDITPEAIEATAQLVVDQLPAVVAVLGRARVLAAMGLREADVLETDG